MGKQISHCTFVAKDTNNRLRKPAEKTTHLTTGLENHPFNKNHPQNKGENVVGLVRHGVTQLNDLNGKGRGSWCYEQTEA